MREMDMATGHDEAEFTLPGKGVLHPREVVPPDADLVKNGFLDEDILWWIKEEIRKRCEKMELLSQRLANTAKAQLSEHVMCPECGQGCRMGCHTAGGDVVGVGETFYCRYCNERFVVRYSTFRFKPYIEETD